jgi:hypothetical protein
MWAALKNGKLETTNVPLELVVVANPHVHARKLGVRDRLHSSVFGKHRVK